MNKRNLIIIAVFLVFFALGDSIIFFQARNLKGRIERELDLADNQRNNQAQQFANDIEKMKDPAYLNTIPWRTYLNKTYGFSVQYPGFFSEFQPATAYPGVIFQIWFMTDDYVSLPFMIMIGTKEENSFADELSDIENSQNIISRSDTAVFGYPAKKIIAKRQPDERELVFLIFEKDNYQYIITAENNHFFDRILQTFIFTQNQ